MTSEKRANEFHTDDVLLPRSGKYISLIGWGKFLTQHDQSEALPRPG